jgi:hypothetical protein
MENIGFDHKTDQKIETVIMADSFDGLSKSKKD